MKIFSRGRYLLPLIGVLFLFTSCGEPSRAEYRDEAAETVCKEALRCENLGSSGIYEDYDECMIKERARFNDMWSETHCGDGRINPDSFESCLDRAKLAACDGGLLDLISAADRCHRNRVCTN